MHLWLNTLFIDHAYMFRSPSATILRVYSIKEHNKKLCVANQSRIRIKKIIYRIINVYKFRSLFIKL